MCIGIRIKKLREAKGLSQRELEKIAGISSLCRIESSEVSNPRIDTVKSIAKCLGVSVDELLRYEGEAKPTTPSRPCVDGLGVTCG